MTSQVKRLGWSIQVVSTQKGEVMGKVRETAFDRAEQFVAKQPAKPRQCRFLKSTRSRELKHTTQIIQGTKTGTEPAPIELPTNRQIAGTEFATRNHAPRSNFTSVASSRSKNNTGLKNKKDRLLLNEDLAGVDTRIDLDLDQNRESVAEFVERINNNGRQFKQSVPKIRRVSR